MSLVDQYGRPVSVDRKFIRASQRGPQNPYQKIRLGDINDLINAYDYRTILSACRRLFANMGLPKGVTIQKANYSVGRAWSPKFTGKDSDWGKRATEWLTEQFYPVCDVRGPQFDFVTGLYLDSIAIDRDGDYAVLLTESKTGFPQFQRLGAHRIGQRNDQESIVESGPYKNRRINNGVITNDLSRPIAYRVLGEDPNGSEDQDISASNIIFNFNPNWYEQNRGYSAFMHAVDKLLKSLRSEEWEEMTMLIISSISLIEHNETGAADLDNPGTFLGTVDSNGEAGLTTESVAGGTIRYMKANSGNKLESISHDRPGDIWEKFQDRIARHFCVGIDWSYSFAWKPNELNGVTNRIELQKVQRSVEDRQALLHGPARRMLVYAIAKAIKSGILPKNPDWFKWSFNMPQKISIDAGRDSAAYQNEYKLGARNLTEWLAERGKSIEDHYRERAVEIVARKRIQEEVEKATGIEIDDREMQMLNPNEMPEQEEDNKDVTTDS